MKDYTVADIRDSIPRHKTRQWGKRKKINRIVVHTTSSNNQDPNRTARYHISPGNHISKKGCPSICYHDFITKSGDVYHCNNYWDKTWHAGAYNRTSIGVVMAFRGQEGLMPEFRQYAVLLEHLTEICLAFKVLPKNVIGHREVPGMMQFLGNGSVRYKTVCPGLGIDLKTMRMGVTLKLQQRLKEEGLYLGDIDGKFGRKSKKALELY